MEFISLRWVSTYGLRHDECLYHVNISISTGGTDDANWNVHQTIHGECYCFLLQPVSLSLLSRRWKQLNPHKPTHTDILLSFRLRNFYHLLIVSGYSIWLEIMWETTTGRWQDWNILTLAKLSLCLFITISPTQGRLVEEKLDWLLFRLRRSLLSVLGRGGGGSGAGRHIVWRCTQMAYCLLCDPHWSKAKEWKAIKCKSPYLAQNSPG